MEKIVVTGGAGFIGSHLVEALKASGYEVGVYDIALDQKLDVRDLASTREFLKGARYVFHLAAIPSVQYSLEHPEETNQTNLVGTLNVLIAAKEAGVKRVVFASSCAVYGDVEIFPTNETAPAQPKSPYALEKFESEEYLKLFSRIHNLQTVSLRYFNVYGLNQKDTGTYASVIAKFLKLKRGGQKLTITGDGKQTRDYIHVSDVVRANMKALKSDKVGRGEVINIGFGQEISVNTVAELIGGEMEYVPERLEPKRALADISLAKKLLGWEPTVSFKEGITKLLK